MTVEQTIKELFEPTFEAIGDSDLEYGQKRELLYNLYCFACAVYPEYVARPCKTLFEYGCCFLIEPERHPDYNAQDAAFVHTAANSDALAVGGRWYSSRGKDFIKYDYGSELFGKLLPVIPPQDKAPIPILSLYAAAYAVCKLQETLKPLWFTYYFYLDASNEPTDEGYDDKLFEFLHDDKVYEQAIKVRGSMLIGDETELNGSDKLLCWYKPFIDYRREHIFSEFETRMSNGDCEFVAEYTDVLIALYPESVELMNWNAAARTDCVIKSANIEELDKLIEDLSDYAQYAQDAAPLKKYLKLAQLMKKNLEAGDVQ